MSRLKMELALMVSPLESPWAPRMPYRSPMELMPYLQSHQLPLTMRQVQRLTARLKKRMRTIAMLVAGVAQTTRSTLRSHSFDGQIETPAATATR